MITINSFRRLLVWTVFMGILAGLYFYRAQYPIQSQPFFFDGMASEIAEVEEIKISQANTTYVLKPNDASRTDWVLSNKANVPINLNWLRGLITGLVNMKVIEAKAQNPKIYSDMQVDLPTTPESKAVRIQLYKETAEPLIDLVVGKRHIRPSNPESEYIFVRQADQTQSYLVESVLPEDFNFKSLVKEKLLPVEHQRVASLTIRYQDQTLALARKTAEGAFYLKNVPAGKKVKAPTLVNEMAAAISRVTALDLVEVATLNTSEQPILIDVYTFENEFYQFRLYTAGSKAWLALPTIPGWALEVLPQEVAVMKIDPDALLEDITFQVNEQTTILPSAQANEFESYDAQS